MEQKKKVLILLLVLIGMLVFLHRLTNAMDHKEPLNPSTPTPNTPATVVISIADLEKQIVTEAKKKVEDSESSSPRGSESPCCSRHDKVKIACLTGTVTIITAAISAGTALAIHFGNCK